MDETRARAMVLDEIDRLAGLQGSLPGQDWRPSPINLEKQSRTLVLAAEHSDHQRVDDISSDDITQAVIELAEQRGEEPWQVQERALELTGGERDALSMADALTVLAGASTGSAVPDDATMELAAKYYDGDDLEAALSAALDSIPAEDDELGETATRRVQLSFTEAERKELAAKGHALPDGSYPINSVKSLRAAATLAASKHGDYRAARKLVIKMAKLLHVDLDTLPGFGSSSDHDADDRSAVKASLLDAMQGTSRFALSEIERLSQVQLAQQRHPVTGRFISQGRGIPQPVQTTDPDPTFDVQAEIERLVANSPELFRSPGAGRHQGRNQADFRSSYGPPSPSTFGQRARTLAR